MHRLETFSPSALQPFVSCLVNRGIQVKRYLQQHHIPVELISAESGKIFKRQAYGFFRDVAEYEGLAGFGFLDGDPYSIEDLGMLGQATLQATTLKDGLLTFAELLAMVAEGNHVWVEEGAELSWVWCQTYDLRRTDYVPDHTSILVLRELIRLVAGSDWQPPRVHFFTEPVTEIDRFLGFYDTRIEFLQDVTGIAFPTNMLARRLDRSRGQEVIQQNAEVLPTTTSGKIEAVLESLYQSRHPASIDLLAEMVGMSRVTLFRTLAQEGTNYRQLVNRVSFKMAVDLLENTNLSISEIARQLGYSTTGNFIRAFQKMSGLTPAIYRERSPTI